VVHARVSVSILSLFLSYRSILSGGAEILIDRMKICLDGPSHLKLDSVVTGIFHEPDETRIHLKILGDKTLHEFNHVISTIPMPCLRTVELDCGLNFIQRNSIRMLDNDPSAKVGIKFKSAWWKKDGIKGGHSYTDRCVRIVEYPTYDDSTVLLATYCDAGDARLFSGLIGHGKKEEARLKDLILRDLAAIHHRPLETLEDEFEEMYAHAWSNDPFALGMFLSRRCVEVYLCIIFKGPSLVMAQDNFQRFTSISHTLPLKAGCILPERL
jgi:hypothetical protein